MGEAEKVGDEYRGVELWWHSFTKKGEISSELERRYYTLRFDKQHREMIMKSNLEHVMNKGKELQQRNKQRKLYTNNSNDKRMSRWSHIVFEHPATFELIAMDPTIKQEIIEDLLTFKEITVIEDIECSLDLTRKRKKSKEPSKGNNDEEDKQKNGTSSEVTLSGLLNSIDGLWSACGGERIVVFTTNYAENLDPALTRSGRMDLHIELSYCSFEGFKVLAKNYLEVETYPVFEEIEKLIEMTEITPADVAENLMPKSKTIDTEEYLSKLIQLLQKKVEKSEKLKALREDKRQSENIPPMN